MRKNGKVRKLEQRRGGFERFARAAARTAGRPGTFGAAMGLIFVWALFGPVFQFSDTWQLVINTGTTIITFLMVFLIQNTQNRDSEAMQLKLDELIRASGGCHKCRPRHRGTFRGSVGYDKAGLRAAGEESAGSGTQWQVRLGRSGPGEETARSESCNLSRVW